MNFGGSRSRKRGEGASIHTLDDGCLLHILSHLAPFPDRFNAARACWRWQRLISDSKMWLSVVATLQSDGNASNRHNIFANLQEAVTAARPGDTIFIGPGASHEVAGLHIDKPLCLIGGGTSADDTVLLSPLGCESALIFSANGKISNLTIQAELGSCILHKKGNLTVERCALKCGRHPLEHLSCPIVSTADGLAPVKPGLSPVDGPVKSCASSSAAIRVVSESATPATGTSARSSSTSSENGVYVIETRIEGGASAVKTIGNLVLQQVRVVYSRAALTFWFKVAQESCLSA